MTDDSMRKCRVCGEVKALELFVGIGRGKRGHCCKACRMVKKRATYEALAGTAGPGQRACSGCLRLLPEGMFNGGSIVCMPCGDRTNAAKRHSWRRRHGADAWAMAWRALGLPERLNVRRTGRRHVLMGDAD